VSRVEYAEGKEASPFAQMLGGLIMWIPGTLIFTIILSVVFFKWSARGEDDSAGAQVDWKPKAA